MDTSEPMVEISLREYKRLSRAEEVLDALEAFGVDNWCGYDEAIQLANKETT